VVSGCNFCLFFFLFLMLVPREEWKTGRDNKLRKGRRGEVGSSVPRTLVVIGFASSGIVDFRG
jgi:hypothetical protein